MSKKSFPVKYTTCADEDKDTGRCRMEMNLMNKLDIKIGDLVWIQYKASNICCLCRTYAKDFDSYARLENEQEVISFDTLITVPCVNSIAEEVLVSKFTEFANVASKVEVQVHLAENNTVEQLSTTHKKMIRGFLQRQLLMTGVSIAATRVHTTFHKIVVTATVPSSGWVQVTSSTDVVINLTDRITEETENVSNQQTIGGLESVMTSLRELVTLPFLHPDLFKHLCVEPPKGILLKGPPGVGKSLLVHTVAKECGVRLIVINGPEIYGPFVGDTEQRLRQIFLEAHSTHKPCIIFIDELDAICPKRSETQSHESRVVAQLLTLMDGLVARGNIVVVAATNRPNAVDPALRRPGREIDIPVPDTAARAKILRVHTKNLLLDELLDLDALAGMLPGYVGADIAALCREAALHVWQSQDVHVASKLVKITMEDFQHAISVVVPSTQRGSTVDFKKTSWEDIGGLEEIKLKLQQAVEWPLTYPESFKRLGLTPPKGVLLYGPPGCSKTTLVKAIATSTQSNFLSINGATIYSPYLGDAESTVRDIFRKARLGSPSIIFFDEIDAIVGKRSMGVSASEGVQERVLATLLNEMDGVEQLADVLVIAATNRPDLLDSALLRPGRIDSILYVPPPDVTARYKILQIHSRHMPLHEDVDMHTLASQTEYCTGADLENLCREAALLALRENLDAASVEMRHFSAVRASIRASLLGYKEYTFNNVEIIK